MQVAVSGPVPDAARAKLSLLFGCDECTSCCPLENPEVQCGLEPPPNRVPDHIDLEQIAKLPPAELGELLRGTALERSGAETIGRNARIILERSS